ncbi:transcription factor BHLH156-like [Zingiber officinale]|uniref:BHLH domain-containing protein n=1 Tax=Zingiber officinale TaxID=94328 RepID=A0A8J5GQP5_ZINOF|nr:transcription factor BHLH156-like [Zingiber officinale]KAG6508110.1 hypothetical protein ZIOFF_033469 [Zingiber officinale]
MEFMIPFAHADIADAGDLNFVDERVSDDLDYGRDLDDFMAPFDCGQLAAVDADSSLFGEGPLGAAGGGGGQSNCASAKARRDRSKTLVSERKRRVRMKERLYELRSIVPTISKMDKASIISDAVMYVKDLQSQAKKLEEEISMLQSSFSKLENPSLQNQTSKRSNTIPKSTTVSIVGNKIIQVKACEVGEGRFHVKVKGNISSGVEHASPSLLRTSSLYSALESLSCFDLESSNFSLGNEGFLFTMTINGGDFTKEISAASMELWLMGALLKEGFQLMQTNTFI